jgi:hypothetical protein
MYKEHFYIIGFIYITSIVLHRAAGPKAHVNGSKEEEKRE